MRRNWGQKQPRGMRVGYPAEIKLPYAIERIDEHRLVYINKFYRALPKGEDLAWQCNDPELIFSCPSKVLASLDYRRITIAAARKERWIYLYDSSSDLQKKAVLHKYLNKLEILTDVWGAPVIPAMLDFYLDD